MEEAARARSARVFEAKAVQTLQCSFCSTELCCRGMRALLLADTATELFSTDVAPVPCSLVGDEYLTRSCNCAISDVACRTCGNVVGYHVTAPCQTCLKACNNGHLWMFHGAAVTACDRPGRSGAMRWGEIPPARLDVLPSPGRKTNTALLFELHPVLRSAECCR